jgi:hypothetical protein
LLGVWTRPPAQPPPPTREGLGAEECGSALLCSIAPLFSVSSYALLCVRAYRISGERQDESGCVKGGRVRKSPFMPPPTECG